MAQFDLGLILIWVCSFWVSRSLSGASVRTFWDHFVICLVHELRSNLICILRLTYLLVILLDELLNGFDNRHDFMEVGLMFQYQFRELRCFWYSHLGYYFLY